MIMKQNCGFDLIERVSRGCALYLGGPACWRARGRGSCRRGSWRPSPAPAWPREAAPGPGCPPRTPGGQTAGCSEATETWPGQVLFGVAVLIRSNPEIFTVSFRGRQRPTNENIFRFRKSENLKLIISAFATEVN